MTILAVIKCNCVHSARATCPEQRTDQTPELVAHYAHMQGWTLDDDGHRHFCPFCSQHHQGNTGKLDPIPI